MSRTTAAQVLADHEDGSGLLAAVIDPSQVRVAQGGTAHNAFAKVTAHIFVCREVGEQHLYDHRTVQRKIIGEVHLGGSADAEQLDDAVATSEFVTGIIGIRRHGFP